MDRRVAIKKGSTSEKGEEDNWEGRRWMEGRGKAGW